MQAFFFFFFYHTCSLKERKINARVKVVGSELSDQATSLVLPETTPLLRHNHRRLFLLASSLTLKDPASRLKIWVLDIIRVESKSYFYFIYFM